MESKYIQGIQRKIKEIAKDYKDKGYKVIIEPEHSVIPDFLRNFQPDLIATSESENVVVEVKSSDSKTNFKQLEELANIVNAQENWRFELVFTNPKTKTGLSNDLVLLDNEKISQRITELQNLLNTKNIDSAFLLGWATLEASIRIKLISLNENRDNIQKPPLHLLKNLFSFGILNQSQLRKLEALNQNRNKIIHGFESAISIDDVNEIIGFIKYFTGQGDNSELYDWISYQDLESYEDVYCLYRSIAEIDEYGLFSAYRKGDSVFVKSDLMHDEEEELELTNQSQIDEILKIIEEEYMDGMHPEGYYAFYRAMEKDD